MPSEREIILAWLRSGDGIGGDDYVARTIADDIERNAHVTWAAETADGMASAFRDVDADLKRGSLIVTPALLRLLAAVEALLARQVHGGT